MSRDDDAASADRPRRSPSPMVAALLSATGLPLGQWYAGDVRRCLLIWLLSCGVSYGILAVLASPLPVGGRGIAAAGGLALLFYGALVGDAALLARRVRATGTHRRRGWRFYASALVFVTVVGVFTAGMTVLFRRHVAEAYVISSRSMTPTLLPGDQVYVDKLWRSARGVRAGDVVVFQKRQPPSTPSVFRVVGLPGDRIEIVDGRVVVNGEPASRPDTTGEPSQPVDPRLSAFGPVVVPDDHWIVLGDNPRLAKDSRIIGPVAFADYLGIARRLIWSRERIAPNRASPDKVVPGRIRWERIGRGL